MVACGEPAEDPLAAHSDPPVVATSSSPYPATDAEIEPLRRLAFEYWEKFNSYDVDGALALLEESYALERGETIRGDIGRLRMFRLKLGLSEHTPPRLTGPGEGQLFLLMKEPLGIRIIRMAFLKVDAEWRITYAQEVE